MLYIKYILMTFVINSLVNENVMYFFSQVLYNQEIVLNHGFVKVGRLHDIFFFI